MSTKIQSTTKFIMVICRCFHTLEAIRSSWCWES